ncbi:phosphate/phosphite/phosphonate ABC transporter substrate-binding protein [Stigmatella erecta]|nr:PhnD/SsuA/transferrin family substrate-binding protein [Stigmatella erecta]
MPMTASLPMYNAPGMRAVNTAFWTALSGLLREEGIEGVPESLSFERPPVPEVIGDEVLFTQVCGYPLQTVYQGQYRLLARPCYDAAGCTGSTHSAFLVARKSSPARRVADLRGQRFALNSLHSNSGMNLPRRMLAEVAGGKPFFGEVLETGGHGASMRLVAGGGADCASIDCLTYAFSQDHQPELVEELRVIAQTPPSPTLPFVTSARTGDATVAALQRCLYRMSAEPRFASVLSGLRLARIEPAPQAEYSALLDHARRAAELGYPVLA